MLSLTKKWKILFYIINSEWFSITSIKNIFFFISIFKFVDRKSSFKFEQLTFVHYLNAHLLSFWTTILTRGPFLTIFLNPVKISRLKSFKCRVCWRHKTCNEQHCSPRICKLKYFSWGDRKHNIDNIKLLWLLS